MSNPNIAGASTTIYGNTTYYTPGGTTAVILLANTSTSNQVFKINQIVVANVSGSAAASTTVSLYVGSSVTTQGSAPAGGAAYPIASAISVPVAASLIVVDKTTGIYLMENQLISITSGTGSALTYTVSYEVIS